MKKSTCKTIIGVIAFIAISFSFISLFVTIVKQMLWLFIPITLGIACYIVYSLFDDINMISYKALNAIAAEVGMLFVNASKEEEEAELNRRIKIKGYGKGVYVKVDGKRIEMTENIRNIINEEEDDINKILDDFFEPVMSKLKDFEKKFQ